jgi:hypothetical protein
LFLKIDPSNKFRNWKCPCYYKLEELQINSMYLEQVQSYKYLGSTVNSDNAIEEEIQYRITLGNKAYYDKQFFFKSRLVSKKSKLKLYWSIIRPIVTYACVNMGMQNQRLLMQF